MTEFITIRDIKKTMQKLKPETIRICDGAENYNKRNLWTKGKFLNNLKKNDVSGKVGIIDSMFYWVFPIRT